MVKNEDSRWIFKKKALKQVCLTYHKKLCSYLSQYTVWVESTSLDELLKKFCPTKMAASIGLYTHVVIWSSASSGSDWSFCFAQFVLMTLSVFIYLFIFNSMQNNAFSFYFLFLCLDGQITVHIFCSEVWSAGPAARIRETLVTLS